jgi:hypothetical protein
MYAKKRKAEPQTNTYEIQVSRPVYETGSFIVQASSHSEAENLTLTYLDSDESECCWDGNSEGHSQRLLSKIFKRKDKK